MRTGQARRSLPCRRGSPAHGDLQLAPICRRAAWLRRMALTTGSRGGRVEMKIRSDDTSLIQEGDLVPTDDWLAALRDDSSTAPASEDHARPASGGYVPSQVRAGASAADGVGWAEQAEIARAEAHARIRAAARAEAVARTEAAAWAEAAARAEAAALADAAVRAEAAARAEAVARAQAAADAARAERPVIGDEL